MRISPSTASNDSLVHLPEVHGGEVDLERALITEGLEADIALHSFLPGRWADVGHPNVIPHFLAHFWR